jgi:hypothetical protein
MNDISKHGLICGGRSFTVIVNSIVCDAPARSFIKCTKGHSGYNSCDKCVAEGRWHGRVIFEELNAALRTDHSFREKQHPDFHTGISPLLSLDMDMVAAFPLDYMHVVCLGVMKRMIAFWVKGPLSIRFSSQIISQLSQRLVESRRFFPSDFNRRPRPLNEFRHWKATEFRAFLLYLGIVVLKDVVRDSVYHNFCLLHASIFILSSNEADELLIRYAGSLLNVYIRNSQHVYGNNFPVYNVHCLQHIAEDVIRHGPLHSYSAFVFESFLGRLKNLIRGGNFPLQQAVRRLSEQAIVSLNERNHEVKMLHEHLQGPLVADVSEYLPQYKACHIGNLRFSIFERDRCFIDQSGHVHFIVNIIKGESGIHFVAQTFKKLVDFYTYPFPSSAIGIFFCF